MALTVRASNLTKPWAWLAAAAAICLVLASSAALYVVHSGVRLALPWWAAVAAPAVVYALVLLLCVPRIGLGGWLIGFLTLAALHVGLGLATAWLYGMVALTSFEEALAPALWGFPPALVLEMVGALLSALPFMGALAPDSAAPRVQTEAPAPRTGAPRHAHAAQESMPGKHRQAWARPTAPDEPVAAAVTAAIRSAAVPLTAASVPPALEEPALAGPGEHALRAAPLSRLNGSSPGTAEVEAPAAETLTPATPSAEAGGQTAPAMQDFRHALSELFGEPVAKSEPAIEEVLEPPAPAPPASPVVADATEPLTADLPAWAAAEVAIEPPRATEPGAVVRIPFERVVGQLPPGAFRVPLGQVGARLREAEMLLVPQALIVPQLGEGVVQVAWEAVVEQFPAAVFAVAPAEVKERIVNGRLLLPLDEIVRQLSPDVYGASMGRGPVSIPGIEGFPAPFKPLGREEPSPALARPSGETPPISIEVPSAAEVAEDLKWTPPPLADPPQSRPQVLDDPIVPASVVADSEPLAAATPAPMSVEDDALPVEIVEPPQKMIEIDAVSEVIDLESLLHEDQAPVAPPADRADEAAAEVAIEPPRATEPGAVVRIPFERVVGQLPPGAFRVPLGQVGARLREAEMLLVPQALIVPQLGEGVVQVAWEAVVEQFPAAVFAVAPAEVKERIVNGRLLLPLDEIVRQLSPDVYGASMGRGPVSIPGIEGFPAPFKPLGREEPSPVPAPADPVSAAAPAEPEIESLIERASEPTTAIAPPPPVIEPVAPPPPVQPWPMDRSGPSGPRVAEPRVAEPQVAEPQVAEPQVARPEPPSGAERLAALMTPWITATLEEIRIGELAIISVSSTGLAGGSVSAVAGRLSPLIAHGAPQPVEQATLRGLGGTLVLTPVGGSGWTTGKMLAVGVRSGGALARLEMLARRAAAQEPASPPESFRGAASSTKLEDAQTPPSVVAAAEDLEAFGPLTVQSYREPATGALVHCFVSPGASAALLASFAWDLAQAMAEDAPAGALGSFHSAVLRSGSRRLEIRRLASSAGPAPILVVVGGDTGRPGLARRQLERAAARLNAA